MGHHSLSPNSPYAVQSTALSPTVSPVEHAHHGPNSQPKEAAFLTLKPPVWDTYDPGSKNKMIFFNINVTKRVNSIH